MSEELYAGLYEQLVTELLLERLGGVASELVERSTLRPAEAGDRIALHLSRIIERAINGLPDNERVARGIELARELVGLIDTATRATGTLLERPETTEHVLRSIRSRLPDGRPEIVAAPEIPLLDTTLLTNAPGEPRVGSQIATEIGSADRIDVVMAFIRRSGLAPLTAALKAHCRKERSLRVLTTTYTNSTERAAVDLLRDLGAEVKVSYDTNSTRLHAKSWLFHRESGYSTAYIGSSNLTYSAQVSGLEWNVRVSAARNSDVVAKISAVFESYWQSGDFRRFDRDEFDAAVATGRDDQVLILPAIELRLEPFQERLLEQIELARQRGHHHNLLVSATGTGKTVMAAVDYARLREVLPRDRLLFVAHREEILNQSRATFAFALREPGFGETWVGGRRPSRFEHVFASIQSLSASGLDGLDPAHFDVVVVDEFHHAAAPSYRAVLDHLQPIELLGLTATPERTDALPILTWFDNRIAAELRLWDAIDQQRLSPFAYYGVYDGFDLRDVPWRRGRGYDVDGLTRLYTANDIWARRVVDELHKRVDDVHAMRALGYCVSVEHARFMARHFAEAGIKATAIWADSNPSERRQALSDLARGNINALFSVDLFNEGVDLPNVDTLLLLRPTDSPVLFLQQLGRGLRKATGKAACAVLDFVGQHRKEFRFDRRLRALFGGTRRDLVRQIERGFPYLPAGCHMELDEIARDIVLRNIREAVPSRWTTKVEELKALQKSGHEITLAHYLEHSGLELDELYDGRRGWSDLCDAGGAETASAGPHEVELRRVVGRLLHVDDQERIDTYSRLLDSDRAPEPGAMSERERRLLRMLVAPLADQVVEKRASLEEGVALLWRHPQVRAELIELMSVLSDRINHVQFPLSTHPLVPLHVHARYTRVEILAALDAGSTAKVAPWQTGVWWSGESRADALAFTLDKTSGGFSPTTRYRDYAISRELIHWESQGTTRADSEPGQRYQRHRETGSAVFLFTRLRTDDRAFWFLGAADYVNHVDERPMAITWHLHHPLPGDLFASFAAAVA